MPLLAMQGCGVPWVLRGCGVGYWVQLLVAGWAPNLAWRSRVWVGGWVGSRGAWGGGGGPRPPPPSRG